MHPSPPTRKLGKVMVRATVKVRAGVPDANAQETLAVAPPPLS